MFNILEDGDIEFLQDQDTTFDATDGVDGVNLDGDFVDGEGDEIDHSAIDDMGAEEDNEAPAYIESLEEDELDEVFPDEVDEFNTDGIDGVNLEGDFVDGEGDEIDHSAINDMTTEENNESPAYIADWED